jgi:hypothetical protein
MDQTSQQGQESQPEKRDVSRQTMIVLVVLAIVVSLLGTFTVIRETSGMHKVVALNEGSTASTSSQGKVSLTVVDANGNSGISDSVATGRVTFNIAK